MTERKVEEDQAEAPNVDLPEDLQREIRNLARALPKLDYYGVLGLEPGASAEAVRDGFFERSKRFHPDRYYKREIGPYGPLLTEIYKRVLAAYDVLRDESLRETYDRGIGAPPPGSVGGAAPVEPPKPKGPSLRDRKGLRPKSTLLTNLRDQLDRGRDRAKRNFQQGQEALERREWSAAAKYFRLAMALDSREPKYGNALADVLPRANAAKAEELKANAERALRTKNVPAAAQAYAELCQLKPADAELASKTAELLLETGDVNQALDLAKRAVSLDEENVASQKLLARTCQAAGLAGPARRAWQAAWALDPTDEEVKRALQ